jgi:hypothetical protein
MLAALMCMGASAGAQDTKKMPEDWDGLWGRGSPVGAWDPSKPPGSRQEAPLTPEYQATYQSNLAKQRRHAFDIRAFAARSACRAMILYEPIEVAIKPKTTYMLAESMSPLRRIYTDGRISRRAKPTHRNQRLPMEWSDTDNTASTTRSRSRPATRRDRACSTRAASRCTRTTRRS